MNKKKIIPILFLSFVGILVWSIIWSIWTFFTSANFEWTKDDRKMYKIQVETSQSTADQSVMITKINAVMNFRVLSVEKERVKLAFQFSPMEILIDGKRQTALEEISSMMFLTEWDRDGNIMRMIFPSEVSKKDEAFTVQNLLLFQSIITGSRRSWLNKEDDSLGRFTAKYDYGEGKILKSKLKYLKIFADESDRSADDPTVKSDIQNSLTELELEKKGSWIRKGTVREKSEISSDRIKIQLDRKADLDVIPFQPDSKLSIWADNLSFEETVARFTEKPKNEKSAQDKEEPKPKK